MNEWVKLGDYLDKESLVQTEAILNAHRISFQVKSPETHLHSALGQGNAQPFVVEVLEADFERALQLVSPSDSDKVEEGVAGYNTDELKEIVLNPQDWHEHFVQNARTELENRGETVNDEDIEKVKREKLLKLQKGTEPSLIIFYTMWLFAFLGGFIGIIAGYFYWQGKVKGFDDQRYYMYTQSYRKQGAYMFVIGIISFLFQLYYFGFFNL